MSFCLYCNFVPVKRALTYSIISAAGVLGLSAANISGRITDSADHTPLPFCNVKAIPGNSGCVTDADGNFSLELPDGEYTLIVSYVGYKELSKPVTIKGKNVKCNVQLQQNTLTLGEVVVTAKESEGLASGSRIDRNAMSHLQPTSFTDLLELLPGNISKNPQMGQANTITLRETGNLGATGAETSNPDYAITSLGTLFVVDGAPVNGDANLQSVGTTNDASSPDYARNTTNKGVDMRSIATDNIESVEIIRGIPSAEYGNLTSGMVNIRRIRRSTPISARFKADEWSKLFYVGKGFLIPQTGNVLNLDLGYMDSKVDPRNNLEGYKRLNGSARFSSNWMRDWGNVRFNVSGDYTGSFDNAKVDPDLANGKIDEYKSNFQKFSMNAESIITPTSIQWLSNIELNGSVSYQKDILERHRQVAPSRPSAAPTTMEPGVHDGHFIIGEYIADYISEGKPLNAFLKGSVSSNLTRGILSNKIKVGLEWNLSKNLGRGQVYDLMRPLSASWTSRPRNYSEIPALNVLAFYVQDVFTLKTPAGNIDLQAGLRGTSLPGLKKDYAMSGKLYLDPRFNMLWHLPSIHKLSPFVGGGFGLTTKMPTIDYLYPQAHYNDLVQLNYYDIAKPLEHSRLNLRTYIDDATNYNLKPARNRKWEIRLGASLGDNRLSVTFFDERLRSGFRYSSIYAPYSYREYDSSAINSAELTAPPVLESLPYTDRTVLDGYRYVTNGSRIDKQGIEFQLNTMRWHPIRTALIVSGAWFRSTYSNSQMLYSTVSDVIDGQPVSDRYVGIYDYNDGRVNEQFNTNFMFDTQLNNLGLLFTTSIQCMWFVKSTMLPKDGRPAYYVDAADGQIHPYTVESENDLMLRALIKNYNENQFKTVRIAPAMYLNFKATKSIGKWLRISLFVNRIIDYLPDYKVNGLVIRRKADAYFGMELNLTI